MKHVLVVVTLCTLALVFFQCLVTWLRFLDQEYRLLVSLDCKNGREINIYVDTFCDYRTIPVYEVTIDGEIVMNKYSIDLSFDCGTHIRKQDFSIKWDESNTLVAVSYKDQVALVYDFERRAGWPSPNSDRSSKLKFKKSTH